MHRYSKENLPKIFYVVLNWWRTCIATCVSIHGNTWWRHINKRSIGPWAWASSASLRTSVCYRVTVTCNIHVTDGTPSNQLMSLWARLIMPKFKILVRFTSRWYVNYKCVHSCIRRNWKLDTIFNWYWVFDMRSVLYITAINQSNKLNPKPFVIEGQSNSDANEQVWQTLTYNV